MTIDMRVYNGFAVRIAALEPDCRKLTPHAQLHRWECWHTILMEVIEWRVNGSPYMLAPIMDLMHQSGHDAWNPTVKAHAENADGEWEGCGLEDGYECDHCDGGSA